MNVRQFLAAWGMLKRTARRRKFADCRNAAVESLERRALLAADVSVLKDIRMGSASSIPSPSNEAVVEYNGSVYFMADDGTHGLELWRTDGTEANTELFMDIRTGAASSAPNTFLVANGKLFFAATSNTGLRSLYVTDGTPGGTTLLVDKRVDYALGVVGTTAYFYKSGLMSNSGLFWKSDGTPGGTVNFAGGFIDGGFGESVVFDNTIFFSAQDGGSSQQRALWKIDSATDTLVEIPNTPFQVGGFEVAGSDLYFAASPDNSTPQLWKMDTATAAPAAVQAANSAKIALVPQNLTDVNGTLFFTGLTSAEGYELWKSNGTSVGTALVKDINSGTASSDPNSLTAVGSTLFFVANDGTHGFELWSTNGSSAGTALVKDILPGPTTTSFQVLFNLNGLLLFGAPTPQSALPVLWTSNGTDSGTTPVNSTIVNGEYNFTQLGNTAVFSAENVTVGREMFIFRIGDQPAAPVITGPAGVSSSLRPTVTWNAVAGSTEYEIWIRNTSTGQNPMILENVAGTSFTPQIDLGIGNFTAWVRTLGTNGAPNSVWSLPFNFRINTPVTQISFATDPANGFAMIAWQALAGAAKYDVWIDRLDVPTSQAYRNTNVIGTSVTPTSLPNGQYRVWVRGVAVDGFSAAWSASQDFTETQVPAITGGLNPTFDTTPTISWTTVPGAASYQLYVLSINGNFKALDQKNIVGTSFTWPSLPAGPYRYWVRVTGAIVWSVPVDIDTSGRTNVLAPMGITSNVRPTISWRPVDQVVRYELWVDQLGVREKIIYQTNLTSSSFTPTSNLPLGNYRVWVRAVGSSSTSNWSVPVDFTIVQAGSLAEPANDFALLTSVFSDARLVPLLEENERSSVPLADSIVPIPDVPPEEAQPAPVVTATVGRFC